MTDSGLENSALLDVVTPTLNVAKYIENSLLSTKQLGIYANHTIVDSGSNDGTLQKVRSAGVNTIYHPPGNMYAAINRGILETNSKWLTYLNGDDIIYPVAMSRALESAPDNCDVVYGNIDYIDDDGRFLHHWKSAPVRDFAGLFASLMMPFPQQGTIFRRSLWEKLGGFDEQFKFSADFDFFLRAFKMKAKFSYYDKLPLAAFRLHQDQISQNYADKMQIEGQLAVMNSALVTSHSEKITAVTRMRIRNINSYVVRIVRNLHLNQTLRIVKAI